MTRPRRFVLTARRALPELRLRGYGIDVELKADDKIIVDRRHPIAPVTCGNLPIRDPGALSALGWAVFHSRPSVAAEAGGVPPFAVTPSYIGAQHTLENLHSEALEQETAGAPGRLHVVLRATQRIDALSMDPGGHIVLDVIPADGGPASLSVLFDDCAPVDATPDHLRAIAVGLRCGALDFVEQPDFNVLADFLEREYVILRAKAGREAAE